MTTPLESMIAGQIRPNRVTDPRIIAAFGAVPREPFVPEAYRGAAYLDEDIEVKPGRYVMEPMVLARLIGLARLKESDAVLDVGCATGYSTALLSKLASFVVGLEEDAELANKATRNLQELSIDNATVVSAPLSEGLPKQGPYQVIMLEGAVEIVPGTLLEQLDEGGRLVCVRSAGGGIGRGHVITKVKGHTGGRDRFDAAVPPLPGFEHPRTFRF